MLLYGCVRKFSIAAGEINLQLMEYRCPKLHRSWVEIVDFLIVGNCLEGYVKLVPVMCSVHEIMALVTARFIYQLLRFK